MIKNLNTPSRDLFYEAERLLTFSENSNLKLTATELAANGYYYNNTEGKIMCFFCKSVLEFPDSSFRHKYSCKVKNAAAFNVQNTKQEIETIMTISTGSCNKSMPITPRDIAKNEFYKLDYGDEQHNREEYDDVHEEHICPILESSTEVDLKYELNRQKSFIKSSSTPHPLKPQDLAANGFYYKGPADNVCCIFCKCEIKNWKTNDDIKEKHKSISPNCPFLCEKLVGNIPISNQSNKYDNPTYPHFASLSERLNTYSSWPKNKSQKPESLADAGFFHNGKADTVICFSCDGGLCNWEEDDIPWEEHARWFPSCTFLHQMKMSKNIRKENIMDSDSQVQTGSSETETKGGFRNMEDTSDTAISAFHKPKLSYMETPTVLAVLSMGYNRNLVKRIVKNKVKETGSFFSQASDLLEAIENNPHFNVDEDIEEVSDEEEPVQTAIKNDTEMSATARADLIAENNLLKEQKLCKICLDEELSVVFLPCGHLVSCASCASVFSNCPLCRKRIHGMVKIFF